jgi:hypothetical protein
MDTLHEDVPTFMIISCSFLLSMRNVTDKSCSENQNTILYWSTLYQNSCCLWDKVEKYGRARQTTNDNIMWHMCFGCWLTKATDAHWEYVILIAFPWP